MDSAKESSLALSNSSWLAKMNQKCQSSNRAREKNVEVFTSISDQNDNRINVGPKT